MRGCDGQPERRDRRLLRGLEDGDVAGRERRRDLPGREHERRVPGGDHGRRPGGHPLHPVPGALGAPVALLVGDGQVGVVAEVGGRAVDDPQAQGLKQHRHVGALDRRQALDVLIDQVREAVEQCRPPGWAKRGPAGRSLVRGPHSQIRLLRPARRDLGDHRAVDRRDHLKALRARDPAATDPVVGRDLVARDGGARHQVYSRTVVRSSTV